MPQMHNKDLVPYAKKLRETMTKEERRLWYNYLREYPLRFYRQKVIGRYIVDFYCPKEALVVELDGSQHFSTEGEEYDEIRTEVLEEYGLKVLRFPNSAINNNFPEACQQIDAVVQERQKLK